MLIIVAVAFTGCKKDDPVKISGVSLNKTVLTLTAGGNETLEVAVTPDNAENKTVKWTLSDNTIATIDQTGRITAIRTGTTLITVTTAEGGKTASCAVTVSKTVTGITLSEIALTLDVGGSETLAAIVVPDNADNKTVEWTSSDPAVATVAAGVVTAVTAGTVSIIATTKDGGFKAECTVTVNKPVMTMTTVIEGEVEIRLAGIGTVVINWGDGSMLETFTLAAFGDGYYTRSHNYTHTFSGTASRTIIIDGHITHLSCIELQLTALDVTKNPALTFLWCDSNGLKSLDVTRNIALTDLSCHNNDWLKSIDVTKNAALTDLSCNGTQLTSLDVTRNHALKELSCADNQLMNLDVTKNTSLTYLWCYDNQLTSLDVSNNTVLTFLHCGWNQFDAAGCNQSIATAKGWEVDTTTIQ